MDIKQFVKETIKGISEAAVELQAELQTVGVIVNPPIPHNAAEIFREDSTRHVYRKILSVDFDIAVTAGSHTGGGAGASIRVMSVEVSGDGGHMQRNEQVSRVRFSLPLVFAPAEAETKNLEALGREEESQRRSRASDSPNASWKTI